MDNDQKVVVRNQGIGFCGLLFIVLLLLKVGVVETVVVGWSWWWITAPLWGPFCLTMGIILAFLLAILIIFLFGLGITAIAGLVSKSKG